MENPNVQNQTSAPNDAASERLDFLFSQIPDHVYDWLFSEQAANNVIAIGKKFNLSESQTVQMSRITGLAILRNISLTAMALELKKSLGLDDATIRQMTIAIATTQFLPIRDHLVGVEEFIRQLGGSLPAALPPLLKSAVVAGQKTVTSTSQKPMPPTIIQKTLRQLAQDSKNALNQNLTDEPIKIAGFDRPVRPTIKNWLVDYVRIKGAGHHEYLERSDYLFNSANPKALPEKERVLVAAILRAYDDDLPLPIDSRSQTVLLERLEKTENTKSKTDPVAARQENRTDNRNQQNGSDEKYREPISDEDLAGPVKRVAPTPAPRLDGNIIDLKNTQ